MANLATCKCGTKIMWIEVDGQRVPVDQRKSTFYVEWDSVKQEYKRYLGHINHFITCPLRDQFKKKK